RITLSPVYFLHSIQLEIISTIIPYTTLFRSSEGTKYYYRVRAYNALAISAYSSEKNATTLWNIPVAPSGLRITSITSATVSLAWTDNANNETGFKVQRSEEHTSELQSRFDLVCRLLLEKKKKKSNT